MSPEDIVSMIALSPTERLEWLARQAEASDAGPQIKELLRLYEQFLAHTDASEEDLVVRFMDAETNKAYSESQYRFGDLVFEVLQAVGKNDRFHRLLVV